MFRLLANLTRRPCLAFWESAVLSLLSDQLGDHTPNWFEIFPGPLQTFFAYLPVHTNAELFFLVQFSFAV